MVGVCIKGKGRRRAVNITVKKPDDMEEKFVDFRCNGENANEINVPLFKGGRIMFKKDTDVMCAATTAVSATSTPSSTLPDDCPPLTPIEGLDDTTGTNFQFKSLIELPFNSGEYVDYAKPVGSTQHGQFLDTDPPPYYTITAKMPRGAPKYDITVTEDGETKVQTPGYVGKSKDAGTYLLERGELDLSVKTVHKLTKDNVHKYRECTCQTQLIKPCCRTRERVFLLSQQADFASQRSSLEEIFHRRGHLVLFGVKCHPEIAGLGIEYLWGEYAYMHVICTVTHYTLFLTQLPKPIRLRIFKKAFPEPLQ